MADHLTPEERATAVTEQCHGVFPGGDGVCEECIASAIRDAERAAYERAAGEVDKMVGAFRAAATERPAPDSAPAITMADVLILLAAAIRKLKEG